MAYVNKEMKAELVEAVKKVLPKDWKASFSILHYSTLVCTISKAPVDLVECFECEGEYYRVNEYHFKTHCADKEVCAVLEKIINAMNGQNYDNSDVMTDYFDVGYYIDVQFGSYKKAFQSTK